MVNAPLPSAAQRWAVFVFALLFVVGFDAMWSGKRYPYAADSASYIEMADTLYHEGHPRVTPWDFEEGKADRIPQKLFPPGYPLLIAAVMPMTGDARTAALIPGRLAAVLIPVLVVWLYAGALPPSVLALFAIYALMAPGVRGWQFLAYSDVPALAVSMLALGALARGLQLVVPARRPLAWCVLAGVAAGCAYVIRNAGIAVLAITAVMIGESLWRRRAWREAAAIVLGAAAPIGGLWAYNLTTFGRLQPYAMPASTRPWYLNVVDWTRATFTDAGVPWQWAEPLPHAVAPVVIGAALVLVAIAFFRLRSDPRRRALLLLTGGYAVGGGLLLVVSRSRYEWGNLIDERNTLQYTWALVFALLIAIPTLWRERGVRRWAWAGRVALAVIGCASAYDAWTVGRAPTEWWQDLASDAAVIAAARVPPGTLQASNQAVLFRIGAGAPVRNLEIGGTDRDLTAALQRIGREAEGRPAQLLLVCDQYTARYSACGGRPLPGVTAPVCHSVRRVPSPVWLCPVPAQPSPP
jgi:Dolichyl-phosphate-mannose-protein mannosyltransferase